MQTTTLAQVSPVRCAASPLFSGSASSNGTSNTRNASAVRARIYPYVYNHMVKSGAIPMENSETATAEATAANEHELLGKTAIITGQISSVVIATFIDQRVE